MRRFLGRIQEDKGFGKGSLLFRISEIEEIIYSLRRIMRKEHTEDFVATICQRPGSKFQGATFKGSHVIEGFSIISIMVVEGEDIAIDLTSSGVNYNRAVARIWLKNIEYIETYRQVEYCDKDISNEKSSRHRTA